MIDYNVSEAVAILSRTPGVLRTLLSGLEEHWVRNNEGPETWSPYDIVGHLIHGEKTDWMRRLELTIKPGEYTYEPFDRFAQFEESKGKSLDRLLDEFESLRESNIKELKSIDVSEELLESKAIHPALGSVNLRMLLSTWVVHDLSHLAQISRVMCKQYKHEVGPWLEYIPLLHYPKRPNS